MNIKAFIIAEMCHKLQYTGKQSGKNCTKPPIHGFAPFHLGISIGTHVQDLELMNVGPQTITNTEDGTVTNNS